MHGIRHLIGVDILGGSNGISKEKLNINDCFEYSKVLEAIMDGIADIIGVYRPDHTLIMFNKAGYEYYGKSHAEVYGKKCYQILGRSEQCAQCATERAMEEKKLVRLEKYIPELGKYMECSSNPIYDENGEIILIIEQLRDITDRMNFENELKHSEEKYRDLVELSPDAIIVVSQGKIVMANKAAVALAKLKYEVLIGKDIFDFVLPKDYEYMNNGMMQLFQTKGSISLQEQKFVLQNGDIIDVEVASTYIDYNGIPSLQAVIRDISERKRELDWAARIQIERLDTKFPLDEKARMEVIYRPAQSVSGDFYHLHKLNDQSVIGFLGDVSGKGLAAALSVSAVKVLIHEAVDIYQEPKDILGYINKEIVKHLGDEYVAACCFKFDFQSNLCKVVSAGINEFAYEDGAVFIKKDIKGAFLGMFHDGMFQEKIVHFAKGCRFFFYSDGLTDIFGRDIMDSVSKNNYFLTPIVKKLDEILSQQNVQNDDCTLLAIEIK